MNADTLCALICPGCLPLPMPRTNSWLHSMMKKAGAVAARALDDSLAALFPSRCVHCQAYLEEEPLRAGRDVKRWCGLWDGKLRRTLLPGVSIPLRLLCPGCAAGLRLAGPQVGMVASTRLLSIVAFEPTPVLFRLLHAFKYEGCHELGPLLGRALARAARQHGCHHRPGVLVPMPLHPARLATRGYNQSQRLAQAVSRSLRMPLLEDLLVRCQDTPALAHIDAAERWSHVRGAFQLRRRLPPADVQVWLVDDVVTTGATVRAAQAALPHTQGFAGVLSLCRAR